MNKFYSHHHHHIQGLVCLQASTVQIN